MLGNRVHRVVADVRYRDPAGCAGVEVDVVVTGSRDRDHPQPVRCCDRRGAHRHFVGDHDVRFGDALADLVRGRRVEHNELVRERERPQVDVRRKRVPVQKDHACRLICLCHLRHSFRPRKRPFAIPRSLLCKIFGDHSRKSAGIDGFGQTPVAACVERRVAGYKRSTEGAMPADQGLMAPNTSDQALPAIAVGRRRWRSTSAPLA